MQTCGGGSEDHGEVRPNQFRQKPHDALETLVVNNGSREISLLIQP